MTKIIGILLLATAAYLFNQNLGLLSSKRSPIEVLKVRIEQDIAKGITSAGIPLSNGIHHAEIKYRSEKAHEILKLSQPQFKVADSGKIWIEIEILEIPDPTSVSIITQVSVFDIKSNNKISEFARTYNLNHLGLIDTAKK